MFVHHPALKKWSPYVRFLQDRWIDICHTDDVYWQTKAIIDASDVNTYKIFQSWLANGYTAQMVINIRAITDPKKGTMSLSRLIEEMCVSINELPDRKEYMTHLPMSFAVSALGDRCFDALADKKNRITRRNLLDDGERLKKATKEIIDYGNTQLLHWNETHARAQTELSFDDLRRALLTISDVLNRYIIFLTGANMSSFVPVIQETTGQWIDLFKQAWLNPGQQIPSYQRLDSIKQTQD